METLDQNRIKIRKAMFEELEKITDIASLSKEDRMKYDESIKIYRDYLVTIEYEKQKGRAEGRIIGAAEKATEIARNLKAVNLPIETIAKATGLTEEEINKL